MYFKDKKYSDTLHTIGIAPVAAPQKDMKFLFCEHRGEIKNVIWNL